MWTDEMIEKVAALEAEVARLRTAAKAVLTQYDEAQEPCACWEQIEALRAALATTSAPTDPNAKGEP